jgi:pimeloyl-ACP methyl ester carboxylesterase
MNIELSASPDLAGSALDGELAAFRARHTARSLTHGGVRWRYYAGGGGDPVLLRLSGALGLAEFSFQQISLFERQFRVITPDYPAVASLGQMIEGLIAILDAEGAERAHVSGGSFGGMLAQALARRAPERIASLVLSHTGAPDGKRRRVGTAIVAALPIQLLRALLKARLGRTLDAADPFWRRYFDRAVERMTKADIMSRVRLQAEFGAQRWSSEDLARWPGRVLLIEGEDDPLFRPAARARLRALYPTAEVYQFRGTGHAAAVLKPEEYAAVVTRFLLEERSWRGTC